MNYEQVTKSILSKSLDIPESCIEMSHTISDLKDIDSVQFALIIAETEKVIKKEIPIEQLLTLDSVEKLMDIIKKNI